MKNSEIDRRESMTTIYLIRHSIKEKNYGIFNNNDTMQLNDEKEILSAEQVNGKADNMDNISDFEKLLLKDTEMINFADEKKFKAI